jgi:hypothetical protein
MMRVAARKEITCCWSRAPDNPDRTQRAMTN